MIGDVAIHNGKMPSDSHYASIGRYAAALHTFQVIDLHFDGRDARSDGAGHVARKSSSGVGKSGQHPTVNDPVNLQMTSAHLKPKQHAAARSFYEPETHLLRGAVFLQTTPQLLHGAAF